MATATIIITETAITRQSGPVVPARSFALDKALLRDADSPLHAALVEDAKFFSAITGVPVDWLVSNYIERL